MLDRRGQGSALSRSKNVRQCQVCKASQGDPVGKDCFAWNVLVPILLSVFSTRCLVMCGYPDVNLQRQDPSAVQEIKGSIINSAPVAVPSFQVNTEANLKPSNILLSF